MVKTGVLFDNVSLELFDEVLQFFGLVYSLGCHFSPAPTVVFNLLNPRLKLYPHLIHLCGLPWHCDELWHYLKLKKNFKKNNNKKNLVRREKCKVTRRGKSKITYFEEIMNNKMFKFLQGHVIACSHVLISHGLLKLFPSQIFIFNKIHRNPLRRLKRGRHSGLGWGDFNGHRWVYNMDLDGWMRCRS